MIPPPSPFSSFLLYVSFTVMGLATLIPWNIICASIDYWVYLLPDHSMIVLYSIAYQSSSLIGYVGIMRFGENVSLQKKIVGSFLVYMGCLGVMPFVNIWWISMMICGGMAVANAFASSSIFGMGAMVAPEYVTAVMNGQGICGILVALLRILSKATFPFDESGTKRATILYFGISLALVSLAIVLYLFVVLPSPLIAYYLERQANSRNYDALDEKITPNSITAHLIDENESQIQQEKSIATPWDDYIDVASKTWPMAVSVFLVFFVSLSIFPSISSLLESTDKILNLQNSKTNPDGTGWFPVITNALFCLGDFIGRSACTFPSLVFFGWRGVSISVLVRFIFFPLFVLLMPAYHASLFNGDFWIYIIMMLFSITNGYFATLAMMLGPDAVPVAQKEKAGVFLLVCLTLGLTTGVWCSNILLLFL